MRLYSDEAHAKDQFHSFLPFSLFGASFEVTWKQRAFMYYNYNDQLKGEGKRCFLLQAEQFARGRLKWNASLSYCVHTLACRHLGTLLVCINKVIKSCCLLWFFSFSPVQVTCQVQRNACLMPIWEGLEWIAKPGPLPRLYLHNVCTGQIQLSLHVCRAPTAGVWCLIFSP